MKNEIEIKIARTHFEYVMFSFIILENKLHNKGSRSDSIIKQFIQLFLMHKHHEQKRWINCKYKFKVLGKTIERPKMILATIYLDNSPIGCIYVENDFSSFFIKEEHRRMGYMSKAWTYLKTQYPLDHNLVNTGHSPSANKFKIKFGIPNTIKGIK